MGALATHRRGLAVNNGARALETNDATAPHATLLPAVVGFFFSFRLIIVLLAARIFGIDPQTGAGLTLAINFLLLGVVAFHSLGPVPLNSVSLIRLPSSFWVFLFLGFSGLSLFWSFAESLSAAVVFWCAMAADTAMVFLLLRTGPVGEMSSALMRGYVYASCCIALVAWILPAESDLRLGDEKLLGPNAIGYACAFSIFLAEYLVLVRRDRGPWKFSVAFLAITLLRSLCKTAIIGFIVGQAVLLITDKSISRKNKLRIVLIVVVVLAATSSFIASYLNAYIDDGSQAESLTGRVGIWAYIFAQALERPWVGYGFHSVWKVIPPFYTDQFEARHAHNELLQQFYSYGVVGVFMLIGLYRSFYRQVRKLPVSPLKSLLFGLFFFVLVRGLADTETFDLSLPLWAIMMYSAVMAEKCGVTAVGGNHR
ncbi:MAG: oligosaccharide repeat unit polymerase [Terracidiphilus sp.]|jgi:O-antigen ligase